MKKSTAIYFWGGASITIFALLILVQSVLMGWRAWHTKQMIVQHDRSLAISLAVDEFRTAVREMSRYAHTYCQTQRQTFYDEYEIIRNWSSGHAPRPDDLSPYLAPAGTTISHRDLIFGLKIPPSHQELWQTIFAMSNNLQAIEKQAMESVKQHTIAEGPLKARDGESPQVFALRVLQESEYHNILHKNLACMDRFMIIYTEETQRANESISWQFAFLTIGSLIWQIVAAAVLGCTFFLFWRAYRNSSDERMRIMFDSVPMSCALLDTKYQVIDCNLAMLKLYQLSSVEEFRRRYNDLIPELQPDGTSSLEGAGKKFNDTCKYGFQQFEWMYQTLAGEPRPVELTLVRVPYENQQAIAAYARDLRTQQSLQRALNQERLLLLDILNSSPVCLAILVRGKMKFVTPFMTEFLGVKLEDDLLDFFADRALGEKILSEALSLSSAKVSIDSRFLPPIDSQPQTNSGERQWYAVKMNAKHGRVNREMLAHACATEYYGENGVMIWLTDVSQLMKVEEELRIARDAAEASAMAKSEFLANMSHEIRTPMNAIHGMTYLCLQTDLNEEQRSYLNKAQTATTHLLGIINDILDFSKIEAGKLHLEKIEFRLSDVVEGVLDVIEYQSNMKGINFVLDVAESVHNYLVGDPLRLRQILLNLTNNAVKFTEAGGVTLLITQVEPTEKNKYSDGQTTLRFMVRDTGIGMTSEQIENLFIAFTQADGSTTRRYGGTGLGLTISKNLVERMGGTLKVESVPRRGATFSFEVCFTKAYEEEQEHTEIDFTLHRALVVDDDHGSRELVSSLAKSLSMSVSTASGGEDAIKQLKEATAKNNPFTVLLIDWMMPDMDGLETIRHIHAAAEVNTPCSILMISAYDTNDCRHQAKELNVADVLTKPITHKVLQAALTESLEKSARKIPTISLDRRFSLAGARVLLAEDNKVNQLVTTELLKLSGLAVDLANDGIEAVQKVRENDYDLILMDIQMPNQDGLCATREIRAMDKPGVKKIPILAMTAHAMSGDREKSIEAGMNDHITKPINPAEFRSALERWLLK